MKSNKTSKELDKKLNNPRFANKTNKTNAKSNHKHEYIEVLFLLLRQNPVYSNKIEQKAYRTRICALCGKVRSLDLMEVTERNGMHFYTALSTDEMLKKYPNHLVFDLGDKVYKKYYDLDREGYVDIRTMYENQVKSFLPDNYGIGDENITNGLLNNVKPETMATLIMRRKECVSTKSKTKDSNDETRC